jgi:hypothetical protein
MSSLQISNPFIISPIISGYFNSLTQVIAQSEHFVKSTTLKYALLALRKFIR